jgi:hypothetical protein
MYVCMRVCLHTYTQVLRVDRRQCEVIIDVIRKRYVCMYVFLSMYVCMYVCIPTHKCLEWTGGSVKSLLMPYARGMYECMCSSMYVCVCVCVYIYIYIYIYIHTYIHTHTRIHAQREWLPQHSARADPRLRTSITQRTRSGNSYNMHICIHTHTRYNMHICIHTHTHTRINAQREWLPQQSARADPRLRTSITQRTRSGNSYNLVGRLLAVRIQVHTYTHTYIHTYIHRVIF